jgi:hypothetical protein
LSIKPKKHSYFGDCSDVAGFMSTLMASTMGQKKEMHVVEIEHRLAELNQKIEGLVVLPYEFKHLEDTLTSTHQDMST